MKILIQGIKISFIALLFSSCNRATSGQEHGIESKNQPIELTSKAANNEPIARIDTQPNPADAATILARKQVPVLCYHQIREWRASDSKSARDVITSPATFRDQIKVFADSGYTAILPDQLYDYLLYGDKLPEKPFMITFDDNDATQYSAATPILKEFGFKAVYFIMTVTIGRPRYMNKEQLKELAEDGNVIASHTWDHHNVQKYLPQDWVTQIEKPAEQLEKITGKKVEYFAYPFGLWNAQALPELEKRGMKASFILSTKRDPNLPMQTIRRIIGSGHWSGKTLYNAQLKTFEDGKG